MARQTSGLVPSGRLAGVEWFADLDSTSSEARRQLDAGLLASGLPRLILAEHQSAGRGRGDHRWWSARDSLACTWAADPTAWQVDRSRWPTMALVAGLAVVEACGTWIRQPGLGLRWPNDVYLGHRKLAGILTELALTPDGQPRLLVGIGCNVNDPLDSAPAEIRQRATSLLAATGQCVDRGSLLRAMLERLDHHLHRLGQDPDALGPDFDAACLQRGQWLTIATPQTRVEGQCQSIAADGALMLQTAQGLVRVVSGSVVDTRD